MDASAATPAAGREGEGDTPRLELDDFSGTLALLLSLARAHAIDLARLSLADCIQQVAAALEQNGPTLCLAQRADWLVMAAWLVLLWSRLLLPETSPTEGVGETGADQSPDDPQALPAAQALAAWLERRPQLGIDVLARGRPEVVGTEIGTRYDVDVIEFLWACLAQFDDGADGEETIAIYRPPGLGLWTVLDARERILQLLADTSEDAPLYRFLPKTPARAEVETPEGIPLQRRSGVASTLIAGLELAREGMLTLHQEAPFATITLSARAEMARHKLDEALA